MENKNNENPMTGNITSEQAREILFKLPKLRGDKLFIADDELGYSKNGIISEWYSIVVTKNSGKVFTHSQVPLTKKQAEQYLDWVMSKRCNAYFLYKSAEIKYCTTGRQTTNAVKLRY